MNGYPAKPGHDLMANPLPFPAESATQLKGRPNLAYLPGSAEDVLDAIDTMSRRIDDLARELHCLGYFDDGGDDGPRAA